MAPATECSIDDKLHNKDNADLTESKNGSSSIHTDSTLSDENAYAQIH